MKPNERRRHLMSFNPLINKVETPFETHAFDKIRSEHFLPALEWAVRQARKNIDEIKTNTDRETFENVIVKLENSQRDVDRVASVFFNLHSAESSKEIQNIAKEFSPILTAFENDLSLDDQLFKKVKSVYDQRNALNLDTEEMTLLENCYLSFVRNGALLSTEDKQKLRDIDKRKSELQLMFGDNVLEETNSFELLIDDESDLAGLPDASKEAASSLAKDRGHEGKWLFTLHFPSYLPLMTYLDNREIRKKMYMAQASKGFKDGDRDNREIIKEIVLLRHQRANLLGYKTHAEFVLERRMAETPRNVFNFLDELMDKAKPAAMSEVKELEEFAKKQDSTIERLENWDYFYFSNKLKKEKFNFDDEKLRPYFKLENVVDGAFKVAGKLFNLHFQERSDIPVYHEEVKAYEVLNSSKQHIGVFYADFFPREGKRSGAWMTSYRSQRKEADKNIRPHVSIVCNFTKPTSSRPSLLTFNEVQTLFHEFGHALHELLSDCRFESLSGASVFWDFVELPSQILENWTYEKECLDLFARHYETEKAIPEDLIERLKKAATFHAGRNCVRQLELAYLDMNWHSKDPSSIHSVDSFEKDSCQKTSLLPRVEGTNVSCSFGHIFQGGYSSGYYSYKWAEVLDADAFEVFKENGIFDQATAQSFQENILSRGGSEHPMELYKRFRGKEPSPQALLKREGLAR